MIGAIGFVGFIQPEMNLILNPWIFTQLPESPRWLVKHGRHAEALAVISALDDAPVSNPEVMRTYHAIREAVIMEGAVVTEKGDYQDKASLKELFTHGRSQNFRRAALGVIVQCFQQITGINLIT